MGLARRAKERQLAHLQVATQDSRVESCVAVQCCGALQRPNQRPSYLPLSWFLFSLLAELAWLAQRTGMCFSLAAWWAPLVWANKVRASMNKLQSIAIF